MGLIVAGPDTAHLNSAVTFTHVLLRRLPRLEGLIRVLAQTCGSFLAAVVIDGNYFLSIDKFEGEPGLRTITGPSATSRIFASLPENHVTMGAACVADLTASMLFMFLIFAWEDLSTGSHPLSTPIVAFFTTWGMGASLS